MSVQIIGNTIALRLPLIGQHHVFKRFQLDLAA